MTMQETVGASAAFDAGVTMACPIGGDIDAPYITYEMVCVGADGVEKWRETFRNTVTTAGKNDLIDKYFKGSGYTAAWYLGLKGSGSVAAGDTLASHSGWSEVTPYSGNRPAITFGSTSGGSNAASAVSYSITGSATVAGAFIASANSGTSGTLYSAGDFAASRSVASGDTLNVTPTVSAS
jgi:hypothetical protein